MDARWVILVVEMINALMACAAYAKIMVAKNVLRPALYRVL
jgi:hypothetical protein